MSRIGGDEFAAILPGTDADGAFEFAERLRVAIGDLQGELGVRLTMSFGAVVAQLPDSTPETLIRAADRALYEAKRLGRDQSVLVAGRPASPSRQPLPRDSARSPGCQVSVHAAPGHGALDRGPAGRSSSRAAR
jgi:hypothetical protein